MSVISEKNKRMFSNKALAVLFIPLIIEQTLAYSVGMIDTMMVASLGEAAVSGVALDDFVMTLIISLFSALATGGAVIAGQYLGKKQYSLAVKAANQMMKFVLGFSVVVMLLVFFLRNAVFDVLYPDIEPEVRQAAYTYLVIAACSIPFLAVYNGLTAVFRIMGNSKLPMKVMFFANIANIIGNAFFVFVLKAGVAGIAFSTVLSRIGSTAVLYIMCQNREADIYMDSPFRQRSDIPMVRRILGIGIPYGLENCMFNLGRLFLTSLMSGFGTASIAANSVGGSIVMFQILGGMSIGLGMTTVISQCIGAGDMEQARYYTKKIFKIIYICHLICTAMTLALFPALMRLYDLSAETVRLTWIYLWIHGISTFTIWPFANSMPIVFRAGGSARFSMIVSTASMVICRISMAYFYSLTLGLGVAGIWLAMVTDWVVKGLIYMWYYFSGRWVRTDIT